MSNKKSKTIRVLIVEPGKAPYAAEIPSGLESLQQKVEGLIQVLYPSGIHNCCPGWSDPYEPSIRRDG